MAFALLMPLFGVLQPWSPAIPVGSSPHPQEGQDRHLPSDPQFPTADDQEEQGRASDRLEQAPPEVLALLQQVLEQVPEAGVGVEPTQFDHWASSGHPTQAVLGIKAVPGLDPEDLIRRVMDVDGYEGRIPHVVSSRSRSVPATDPPEEIDVYQRIQIPGIVQVQHELRLVDAGTIKGYRVAYWSLLPEETAALDRRSGARSAFNVGVWLAAPGVVGYAFQSWPTREDVNAVQWFSMTTGAAVAAQRIVEGNIDAMAEWARQ